MTRSEIFVDAAFIIALLNTRDQHHAAAVAVENTLPDRTRLVITRAVCIEIGNALAWPEIRARTAGLLASIEGDPKFVVVPWDERVYAAALALFRDRPDKAWSLTDCMSFIVMRDRWITDALTSDDHFRQAGFQPLLRNSVN